MLAMFLCIVIGDVFGDLQRVEKTQLKDSTMSQQADVTNVVALSHIVRQYFLNKLPGVLRSKILTTDDAEKLVLENYVNSRSVPPEILNTYNLAKKDERELLKRLLMDIPIILPTYKSIRKGVVWNHTRLHDKYIQFFQEPSTALEKYEAIKRDELTSLDSFLAHSGQSGATKLNAVVDAEKPELKPTETAKKTEGGEENDEETKAEKAEKAEKRLEDDNAEADESE